LDALESRSFVIRFDRTLRGVFFAAFVFAFVGHPKAAVALPLFADAQGGVSCETCHTVPPSLNAYGRYILATNFMKGIDPHAQMRQNERDPIAFLSTLDGSSLGPPKGAAKNYNFFTALASGGYLGPKFTYYVALPLVENGNPAGSVYQSWIAYNGFSHGNGSLQVGKFATPFFAPWLGMPTLSLQAYAAQILTVGQNDVMLGENRWGASYTQVGSKGLVGTVAYMTDQGAIENAFNANYNAPPGFLAPPGAQGGTFVAGLQYVQPSSRWSGGIAVLGGQFPLANGQKDSYQREAALVSYALASNLSLTALKLFGQDANPFATGVSAASNSYSLGVTYNPTTWAHIEFRDERNNSGPGTIYNAFKPILTQYVTAVAFNPMPNMSLTLYDVPTVGQKPTTGYELAYTGPWFHHAAAPPETVAVTTGGSSAPGQQDYAVRCAACHGATGGGGVGPNLHNLSLTQDQTVAFIKNPSGNIMPHLYPSQLNEVQVEAISTYIHSAFGPGGAAVPTAGAGAAPAAASAPAGDTAAGAQIFSVRCSACHGADGSGGVGPNLHGIASRKTLDQTVGFIENPSGGIMPKLYPSQLNQTQVQQVAAYIQTLK
jgi:mono/diheme cytochrome c family protein